MNSQKRGCGGTALGQLLHDQAGIQPWQCQATGCFWRIHTHEAKLASLGQGLWVYSCTRVETLREFANVNRGDLVGLVSTTQSVAYRTVPLSLCEDEQTLALKKKGDATAQVEGKPLQLQLSHQMTVKNCVPSATILDMVKTDNSLEDR